MNLAAKAKNASWLTSGWMDATCHRQAGHCNVTVREALTFVLKAVRKTPHCDPVVEDADKAVPMQGLGSLPRV